MRFGGYAPSWRPDSATMKQMLKNEADALQSELDSVTRLISEIDSEKTPE
jgi:prefoldin subunit 5